MVLVYTSPKSGQVHLAQNLLENNGIECFVRGEHLAAAVGGVAPIDAWMELWIVNEVQAREARALIDEMLEAPVAPPERWLCPNCIEWREGQFSNCWQCGVERLR